MSVMCPKCRGLRRPCSLCSGWRLVSEETAAGYDRADDAEEAAREEEARKALRARAQSARGRGPEPSPEVAAQRKAAAGESVRSLAERSALEDTVDAGSLEVLRALLGD